MTARVKNITAMSAKDAEKIKVKFNRQSLTPFACPANSAVILNYEKHFMLKT